MAKIPFNVKFRPQIESGEYKVETFSGYPVTIYRWDFDDGEQTPIMGSYVFVDGKEYVGAWNEEGHFDLMSPNDIDLFIVTPEEELTEWQRFISACLQKHGLLDCGAADRIAKESADELLKLAKNEILRSDKWIIGNDALRLTYERGKAEALKDLPRWKKCDGQYCIPDSLIQRSGLYAFGSSGQTGDKFIPLRELEKLPGFKED